MSQLETKEAEQVLPSLEVCTFTKGKKCYSLYAATFKLDHMAYETFKQVTFYTSYVSCLAPQPFYAPFSYVQLNALRH